MYIEHPTSHICVPELLGLVSQLDISPGPGGSRCTDYGATWSVFRPALSIPPFDREWTQAMVVALYPSAQLVGHRDPPIKGTRFHIPLQTNDGCWVHHDGVWVQLQLGHLYEMNPAEFHGAVNWGHDVRLHLAVDVL